MSFPPTHLLVGAGVAEVVRVWLPVRRRYAWTVGGAFGVLPDFDFALDVALGRGGGLHATWSHSVAALLAVVALAWAVGGRGWAALVGGGYASHIGVDLLDRGIVNLQLWWPISTDPVPALYRLIPVVPFLYGGSLAKTFALVFSPEAAGPLLKQTAVGAGVFVCCLVLAWALRQGRVVTAMPTGPAWVRRRARP